MTASLISIPSPGALGGLCAVVVFLILTPQLVDLVHELGHALWGLLLTDRPVYIMLEGAGGGDSAWKMGRLVVATHLAWGHSRTVIENRRTLPGRWQLAIAITGPVFSVVLAVGLGAVALALRDESGIAYWLAAPAAALSLLRAITNLWPRTVTTASGKKWWTDGRVVLDVVTGGPGLPL